MATFESLADILSLGEEKLLSLAGVMESPEFITRLTSALPFVEVFCQQYRTKLIDVYITSENGHYEPMFLFEDDLGGYTFDGVKNSLE